MSRQQQLDELTKAAEDATDKYARGEITKQECSDAQRALLDFIEPPKE